MNEVTYYDFKTNHNLDGWTEVHECRRCKNSSFSGGCTCTYTSYQPDPKTIPLHYKLLLVKRKKLEEEKERIRKEEQEEMNRRAFQYMDEKEQSGKAKSVGRLMELGYTPLINTKRFIIYSRTWIIFKHDHNIDIKVTLEGELNVIRNNAKVLKVVQC